MLGVTGALDNRLSPGLQEVRAVEAQADSGCCEPCGEQLRRLYCLPALRILRRSPVAAKFCYLSKLRKGLGLCGLSEELFEVRRVKHILQMDFCPIWGVKYIGESLFWRHTSKMNENRVLNWLI